MMTTFSKCCLRSDEKGDMPMPCFQFEMSYMWQFLAFQKNDFRYMWQSPKENLV